MLTGKRTLQTAGLALLYVALSRLTLSLSVLDGSLIAVWLPAGLALAAFLRGGLGLWPGVLVGAWIGNLLGIAGPVAALGEAAGATLGGLVAAAGIKHFVPSVRFDRLREVIALVGAAFAGAFVSGTVGVTSLWLADLKVWSSWGHGVLVWSFGDVLAMLLLAPLLLAAARLPRIGNGRRAAESVLTVAALIAAAELLFHSHDAELWLLMPVCVWIGLRHGFHGAVAAGFGLAIVSVTATDAGNGPFAHGTQFDLVRAQAFGIVAAGTLLVVAAVTGERRRALRQYRAIAAEDAALRRVATAVARNASVAEVCAMAENEVADLLGIAVRFDGTTCTKTCSLEPDVAERLSRFADLVGLAVAGAAAQARLVAEATTDPLTGLLNHRALHERLSEQAAIAARTGQPLSVVVFDVDRFKALNEALGYEVGDDVLREVARRARAAAREGELLARVGGDEFAALLPGTSAEDARLAAERLRHAIVDEPFQGELELTLSAGVADTTVTHDGAELLALADGALYWAKSNGRDTTCVYDPAVVEELSATERAERLERTKALGAVRALAQAIDAKDAATIQHSERVATLAARLAEASGWSPPDVARLHDAGLVHDVGKIGIPDAILSKPGRLTDEEYDAIKRHSALGARIVSEVLDAEQVAWVRGHHERHDGRGYPDALCGEDIAEGARLMALADAWDAMTGARVYSDAMPIDAALAEVERCEGTQFHPAAVAALRTVFEQGRLATAGADGALTPSR
jgi:diguanylate cyclase (GGDEF)-like protein